MTRLSGGRVRGRVAANNCGGPHSLFWRHSAPPQRRVKLWCWWGWGTGRSLRRRDGWRPDTPPPRSALPLAQPLCAWGLAPSHTGIRSSTAGVLRSPVHILTWDTFPIPTKSNEVQRELNVWEGVSVVTPAPSGFRSFQRRTANAGPPEVYYSEGGR
eukprot:gene22785-biopygen8797